MLGRAQLNYLSIDWGSLSFLFLSKVEWCENVRESFDVNETLNWWNDCTSLTLLRTIHIISASTLITVWRRMRHRMCSQTSNIVYFNKWASNGLHESFFQSFLAVFYFVVYRFGLMLCCWLRLFIASTLNKKFDVRNEILSDHLYDYDLWTRIFKILIGNWVEILLEPWIPKLNCRFVMYSHNLTHRDLRSSPNEA